MANKPLLRFGPFAGLDATSDPGYIAEGKGSVASNVDVSQRPGAFSTARGRVAITQLAGVPSTYIFAGLHAFTSFVNPVTITDNDNVTLYVFSTIATDGSGASFQGVYDPDTATTTQLADMRPWTFAEQFGDGLWLNSGQQFRLRQADGHTEPTFMVEEWQVGLPNMSVSVNTTLNSNTPGTGTYDYAITFLRTSKTTDPADPSNDLTIQQESSPFYIPVQLNVAGGTAAYGIGSIATFPISGQKVGLSFRVGSNHATVTATASGEPGADSLAALTEDLATLANSNAFFNSHVLATSGGVTDSTNGTVRLTAIQIGTGGNSYEMKLSGAAGVSISPTSYTFLSHGVGGVAPAIHVPTNLIVRSDPDTDTWMMLYRQSTLQPVYLQVDAVNNMPMTVSGATTIVTDTLSDQQIIDNVSLDPHHDTPPFATQIVSVTTNKNVFAQQRASIQTLWIDNPGFVRSYKGRLCAFVFYPNLYQFTTNSGLGSPITEVGAMQLSPQLWFSDYNVPWSYDGVNNVVLFGPESTPGLTFFGSNFTHGNTPDDPLAPRWDYGSLYDAPMGLAVAGSILVALKLQSIWMMFGDSPSEFVPRQVNQTPGCIASRSIIEAEGGVFWLSEQGFYFFSGAQPSYLSEDIRGEQVPLDLDGYSVADLQACVGWYKKRTCYWSFPTKNITWCYYVPAQKWWSIPYAVQIASRGEQSQIVTARTTGIHLDQWSASWMDLGNAIAGTWTSGIADVMPGYAKTGRYCLVTADCQPGVKAEVTLTFDSGFGGAGNQVWSSGVFDLGSSNGSWVFSLPSETFIGYQLQGSVTVTNANNAAGPATLRSITVLGELAFDVVETQDA